MSSTLKAQIFVFIQYSFIQFSWLRGNVLFLSEDWLAYWAVLCWSVIARRGRRAGSNTGLMFNATQHPNETGHWFAFRVATLQSRGREGRLLQFKAEIYVRVLDNSDSLDRDRESDQSWFMPPCHSIMNPSHRRHHFGVVLEPEQQRPEAFCPHKYPGSKQ